MDQEPTKELIGGQRSKYDFSAPEFASDTFWHQNNIATIPEHYSKTQGVIHTRDGGYEK